MRNTEAEILIQMPPRDEHRPCAVMHLFILKLRTKYNNPPLTDAEIGSLLLGAGPEAWVSVCRMNLGDNPREAVLGALLESVPVKIPMRVVEA